MGIKFFDNLGGTCIYNCGCCGIYLSNKSEVISPNFTGVTGKAYLFKNVINIRQGECNQRELMSGLHFVRDVYCINCNARIGWMYEMATTHKERYKEGAVTLERKLIRKVDGFEEESRKVNTGREDLPITSADIIEEDMDAEPPGIDDDNRGIPQFFNHPGYRNPHNVQELEDFIAARPGFPNLRQFPPVIHDYFREFRNMPGVNLTNVDQRTLATVGMHRLFQPVQNAPETAATTRARFRSMNEPPEANNLRNPENVDVDVVGGREPRRNELVNWRNVLSTQNEGGQQTDRPERLSVVFRERQAAIERREALESRRLREEAIGIARRERQFSLGQMLAGMDNPEEYAHLRDSPSPHEPEW